MNLFSKIYSLSKIVKNRISCASLTRADFGRRGECAAAKYLKKKVGMKILRRNFKIGKLETDIIALDGDTLVFVEVKSRIISAKENGYFAAVASKKRANLKECAIKYLKMLNNKPNSWRFDVVDIEHSETGKILKISHYINIPL